MGRLALSVRQPYAEDILAGTKVVEYRSRRTHRRGRVYLYAAGKRVDGCALPRGLVVGTVEIVGCEWLVDRGCWGWKLERPRRIKARRPTGKPQPVFFYPFKAAVTVP